MFATCSPRGVKRLLFGGSLGNFGLPGGQHAIPSGFRTIVHRAAFRGFHLAFPAVRIRFHRVVSRLRKARLGVD
jgi:hypothetical protein